MALRVGSGDLTEYLRQRVRRPGSGVGTAVEALTGLQGHLLHRVLGEHPGVEATGDAHPVSQRLDGSGRVAVRMAERLRHTPIALRGGRLVEPDAGGEQYAEDQSVRQVGEAAEGHGERVEHTQPGADEGHTGQRAAQENSLAGLDVLTSLAS